MSRNAEDPLFYKQHDTRWKGYTREDVSQLHKKLTAERGDNPDLYGSHSGRIGAAIDLSEAGVPIAVLAHWVAGNLWSLSFGTPTTRPKRQSDLLKL